MAKNLLPLLAIIVTAFLFPQYACHSASNTNIKQSAGDPDPDSLLKLQLLFVGDIMNHAPQLAAAYNAETQSYNYHHCFKYVKPLISKADFAVGNLELTMPGKAPYSGYPMFKAPDAIGTALKDAGFDMLVTANNHANDGGLIGVTHTIDVIKGLGLYQTGTFKNEAERHTTYPLIVKKQFGKKFIKMAFLNYSFSTNGIPDHDPAIVNIIDTAQMRKDIRDAESTKPDLIISFMHWGVEYQLNENGEQQKLAQFMADLGVDLIIGSHPHVIQPIKSITAHHKDGTTQVVPVVYSLGNYISNQRQVNTDIGLMYEVTVVKNTVNGKISFVDDHYIPVWRYIQNATATDSKKKYYTIPASAIEDDTDNTLAIPAADRVKAKASLQALRTRLAKHGSSERKIGVEEVK